MPRIVPHATAPVIVQHTGKCPVGSVAFSGVPLAYPYRLACTDGVGSSCQVSREPKEPVPGWYQRAAMLTSAEVGSV